MGRTVMGTRIEGGVTGTTGVGTTGNAGIARGTTWATAVPRDHTKDEPRTVIKIKRCMVRDGSKGRG
jgi:hypothetical protein